MPATPKPGSPLSPEQQKSWEEKLKQYAQIIKIVCPVLMGIDKMVMEKVADRKAKGIMDSSIRSIYTGLLKIYSMLSDAYKQVENKKWPDFTNDVPFPPAPPPIPSNPTDMPSWFMSAWKTIQGALNLLADKNSKIAEILPPIEAAGNELVKDLQKYFSPSKQDEFPTLTRFPESPPSAW